MAVDVLAVRYCRDELILIYYVGDMTVPNPIGALSQKGVGRRLARLAKHPRRIGPAVRRRVRSPFVSQAERSAVPQPEVAVVVPGPKAVKLTRADRTRIITAGLNVSGGLGLEIGASHNPLLRKADSYNIRVADHLDQAGLIEKYAAKGTSRIEPVDYVLTPGRLTDTISDRFDYIVASHLAEHTVCLISFLQDCEKLLLPGGALSLALPDMRFCFDRFRERSGLGRVIDVYNSGQLVHTAGMVTEHFLFNAALGDVTSWYSGATGDYHFRYSSEFVQEKVASAEAGEYVDTHNWVLTPNHFRLLLHDLRSLGYIAMCEAAFTDTIDHEFFITLSTDSELTSPSRNDLVALSAAELRQIDDPHFA